MKTEIFKKAMRGIAVGLAMLAIALGVSAVRFAIYAPELVNTVLHVVGN